jgi:hypothetical protein
MAKLTASERSDLPASQFAGPGRSYPIQDATHARKAIQLAPRGVAAGNITPQQAAAIKAKARSKLSQQRFGQ